MPSEEDAKNENSDNNVDAVSIEDEKKEDREILKALHTEDDAKYASSENMLPIPTEDDP